MSGFAGAAPFLTFPRSSKRASHSGDFENSDLPKTRGNLTPPAWDNFFFAISIDAYGFKFGQVATSSKRKYRLRHYKMDFRKSSKIGPVRRWTSNVVKALRFGQAGTKSIKIQLSEFPKVSTVIQKVRLLLTCFTKAKSKIHGKARV